MIKAIQTRYKGYRFRSRLEARWAVFFDGLSVKWEYEPEGYDLGQAGYYLPDFFLPGLELWVEIKPRDGSAGKDDEKMVALVEMTGKRGTILRGDPWENSDPDIYGRPGVSDWSGSAIFQKTEDGAGKYDCAYCFCVCPNCLKVGYEFDGRGARVCGTDCPSKNTPAWAGAGFADHGDKGYSFNHPLIMSAASKARAARFEHGEVSS